MSLCISLSQPYASLLISGIKTFETRSWKPGARNMEIIKREGLLIHASQSKKYAHLAGQAPFWQHLSKMGRIPYGCIIGHVRVGRVIKTEDFLVEGMNAAGTDEEKNRAFVEEVAFGNYSPGRWAWELIAPVEFPEPIPVKGKLSLWSWTPPNPSYSRIARKPLIFAP
jgi:hypothetical protein